MSQDRLLVAIMFADIEGYTSMMQQNEANALAIRSKHKHIIDTVVKEYKGELIQYYGDGTLTIFKSSVEAIRCAISIQKAFQSELIIPVRIGIHVGDVIRTAEDIIGNAVNIASRIESLAVPGSILISDKVNDQLRNQQDIKTAFIDVFDLKNLDKAIPVFAIANEGVRVPERSEIKGKIKEEVKQRFKKYKQLSAIVLFILLSVIVGLVFTKKNVQKVADNNIAIAVLPFDNLSNDADSGVFTDGVTEDILHQLSKIGDLHVISRTSVMQYKGSTKPIETIAKELGVSYVLEGSVRKYGDKVRINAQLVNESNEYMWAENYDKTLTEIFSIQSQVSTDIAEALKITLSIDERSSLSKVPTENAQAYSIYQEGRRLLNQGGGRSEELAMAKDLFERAIVLDPNFCLAYVGLADTYLSYIFWGRSSPEEVLEQALTAALKALELDPTEGGTYGALGSISFYRYEKETAINYLEKALEINPSYVAAYDKLAWISIFEGDTDRAVSLFEKILALDPLSTRYLGNIVQSHYYEQDFEKGLLVVNEGLKLFPEDNMLLWTKATILTALKKYDEAIATFNSRSAGINTNWMLGYTYGVAGQREKALKILDYQLKKAETSYVPPFMIAVIYMGLDNKEMALEYLEKDYEMGGQGLFFWGLKRDYIFDSIQNEPRFQKLLKAIH